MEAQIAELVERVRLLSMMVGALAVFVLFVFGWLWYVAKESRETAERLREIGGTGGALARERARRMAVERRVESLLAADAAMGERLSVIERSTMLPRSER